MVGLPKAIIKKYGITKKAWQVFRGRKGRKGSKNPSNPKSYGGVKRRLAGKRLSLFYTIGAMYGMQDTVAAAGMYARKLLEGQDFDKKEAVIDLSNKAIRNFTGYSYVWNNWDLMYPFKLYGSLILAGIAKKYLGRYVQPGINRIPLINKVVSA